MEKKIIIEEMVAQSHKFDTFMNSKSDFVFKILSDSIPCAKYELTTLIFM